MVRARELKFWETVHPPKHVTCHMSRVTMCQVSHVTCHMSRVMCHFFFSQSGEAYWWRVCYQRGLPRLVYFIFLFRILKILSIPNRKSWGTDILRECSPPTMCHMSFVTSHVSRVKCHILFSLFFDRVVELVGAGSAINGAYPRS